MVKPINGSVNAATYQSLDGSNYTLAGFEGSIKDNGKSVSAFLGSGTDFKDTGLDLVVDLKGKLDYDKQGIFNQNARIRTKFEENYQTFQVRYSPISVNVPVGKNTNLYVNPHYVGQISTDNKWKNGVGAFTGVTQKFGNTSVSLEVQRYNLQNIKDNSTKNWSINATIAVNI